MRASLGLIVFAVLSGGIGCLDFLESKSEDQFVADSGGDDTNTTIEDAELIDTRAANDIAAEAPPPLPDAVVPEAAPPAIVTLSGPEGTKIEAPAGAVPAGTTLSISIATTGYPAIPVSFAPAGKVFAFLPHGTKFLKPVTISVPFTATTSPVSLWTASPGGSWSVVPGAFASGPLMKATVSGFSYFAAGTSPPGGWKEVTGAIPSSSAVRGFAFLGGAIYAAHVSGVYRSLDNGESWTSVSTGLPTAKDVNAIVAHGTQLVAATAQGIYRCTPPTMTWTASSTGLPLSTFDSKPVSVRSLLSVAGGGLFVGVDHASAYYAGERVYYSTDNGATWGARAGGFAKREWAGSWPISFVAKGTVVWAGTFEAGLYWTSDGGFTWTAAGLAWNERVRGLANAGGTIFAGTTWAGLLKSATGAGSWTRIDDKVLTDAVAFWEIAALAADGTRLYADVAYKSVHYADDYGVTWKTWYGGLPRAGSGTPPQFVTIATDGKILIGSATTTWTTPFAHVYKTAVP